MANPTVDIQKHVVVVGSRKSELALNQTESVIKTLKIFHPDKTFDILSMNTKGDNVLDKPLPKIGDKSLFTKELEIALEDKKIHLVVHSLKDLPTSLPVGLTVGAVIEREDPRDAVVLRKDSGYKDLGSLPEGSTVGTSSLRRVAQLRQNFPHLKTDSIRGNLNTRLRKLDDGHNFSAIVLAVAGLKRLDLQSRISQYLEDQDMMYAVGQGALAVECREDDFNTLKMLEDLQHPITTIRVIAERSFLSCLEGGCSAPVAVLSKYFKDKETSEEKLELVGGVWSLDGKKVLKKRDSCVMPQEDETEHEPPRKSAHQRSMFCGILAPTSIVLQCSLAYKLGQNLAQAMKDDGASKIMNEAKRCNETM